MVANIGRPRTPLLKGAFISTCLDVTIDARAAVLPRAATLPRAWHRADRRPVRTGVGVQRQSLGGVRPRRINFPVAPETAIDDMARTRDVDENKTYPRVTAVTVDHVAPYTTPGRRPLQTSRWRWRQRSTYLRGDGQCGDVDRRRGGSRFNSHEPRLRTHFLGIAKIRAARLLWSRVLEAPERRPSE